MGDLTLSIEEANKLRVAMGMAPLPVPGAAATSGPSFKSSREAVDSDEEPASTFETRQAAAEDNWRKLQDETNAKKKREQRAAAIRKEREAAQRSVQLEGKGLADDANDEDDQAWLKGSKKRQKKIAKAEQLQKEFEERERQEREALQYTEADLAGVRVGHEIGAFEDGEDQILVLKDTAVDAEDDDELEAVALKDQERLQERLDSKKRKRVYDPNDVNESGQSSILAQYDEEIDGKKRSAFTLNGKGKTIEALQAEASTVDHPKKVTISLDMPKDDEPANDYMDVSEVKIRKPKKKKAKSSRRTRIDDEGDASAITDANHVEDGRMEVDEVQEQVPRPKKSLSGMSFVDDDDLQASLAIQRQKALKKRKRMGAEEIAQQMRQQASENPDIYETTEGDEVGLIIDETSEFVQNLERSQSEEANARDLQRRQKLELESNGMVYPATGKPEDADDDVDMGQSYANIDEDEHISDHERESSAHVAGTGLGDEETIDRGLGATLKLLRQRGVIQDSNSSDLTSQYRQRQKFLADKQRAEDDAERIAKEQRERERDSARWNNMSAREREEWARKNNVNRDHLTSRKMAEIFNKEYKPNVQLNYVDDHGRHMNPKEAFKQLSHQFHGKGSGNNKTQKHLDKISAERKKEAESSLETTLAGGMSNAQGQQSKKHKQAGVRLQ